MPALVPLNEGSYKLLPSDPFFLPTFGPELDPLDAEDTALAAVEIISPAIDPASVGDLLDSQLAGLDDALAFESGDSGSGDLNAAQAQAPVVNQWLTDSTAALTTADAKIGGPAFKPPPIPGHTILPPVKPGSPPSPPPGPGAPSPPLPPVAQASSVYIRNTKRVGQTDYLVGDTYLVTITAPPGSAITVSGSHDSVNFPLTPFGAANQDGVALISGTMDASTRGAWVENWFANGRSIGSISFNVR